MGASPHTPLLAMEKDADLGGDRKRGETGFLVIRLPMARASALPGNPVPNSAGGAGGFHILIIRPSPFLNMGASPHTPLFYNSGQVRKEGSHDKHNTREHLLSDNPALSAACGADKLHLPIIRAWEAPHGKHNTKEYLLSSNPALSAACGADKLHLPIIRAWEAPRASATCKRAPWQSNPQRRVRG